jgi:hypothetical protein
MAGFLSGKPEIAASRLRVRVQYKSQAEGSSPPGGSRLGLTLDSATTRTSSSVDDGYSLASARFRSRSSWLSLNAAFGLRCFHTVPSLRIRSSPTITLETPATLHPALRARPRSLRVPRVGRAAVPPSCHGAVQTNDNATNVVLVDRNLSNLLHVRSRIARRKGLNRDGSNGRVECSPKATCQPPSQVPSSPLIVQIYTEYDRARRLAYLKFLARQILQVRKCPTIGSLRLEAFDESYHPFSLVRIGQGATHGSEIVGLEAPGMTVVTRSSPSRYFRKNCAQLAAKSFAQSGTAFPRTARKRRPRPSGSAVSTPALSSDASGRMRLSASRSWPPASTSTRTTSTAAPGRLVVAIEYTRGAQADRRHALACARDGAGFLDSCQGPSTGSSHPVATGTAQRDCTELQPQGSSRGWLNVAIVFDRIQSQPVFLPHTG